jgi:beta-lactamase class A
MHMRRFRRIVVACALVTLTSMFLRPCSGAYSEYNTYEKKEYISDAGLLKLYEDIVRDASVTDGVVGVGIIHLETGRELYLNKNERFPMASSVKVPVAVQLMKLVDQGKTSLDSLVTITKNDYSPGSGNIIYQYPAGKSLPLRYLLDKMLTVSDNGAADMVFRAVGGPSAVNTGIVESGIEGMSINRQICVLLGNCWGITGIEGNQTFTRQVFESLLRKVTLEKQQQARKDFITDERDTSTPEAMATLLEKIWRGDILSEESSRYLLSIMMKSHGDSRIKALLPSGTRVYHKTGTIQGGISDVGIIELPNDAGHLVTVVFVKGGAKSLRMSESAMALIARDAFNYFQTPRTD